MNTYKKILGFGVVALTTVQCTEPKSNESKLNVLFIVFDDLRPETGCYGTIANTPNLDEFANNGVLFSRAYCNIPVCGASRASLLTGTRPARTRFLHYDSYADKENPEAVTLPEHFRNNGYFTIGRSKIFGFPDDSEDSWDELWSPIDTALTWRDYASMENRILDSLGGPGRGAYPFECAEVDDTAYFDGKAISMAIQDLHRLKEKDEAFFLAVGLRKPHLPFNAPKKYWDMYNRDQFVLPANYVPGDTNIPANAFHNSGELRAYYGVPKKGPVSDSMAITMIHGYYACMSYVDHLVGELLATLEKLDMEKNTLVVMIGDHGYNLGEHSLWCKHSNFETSLRSLMMIRIPGIKPGLVLDNYTEFVDIFPTLCEACGLPFPETLEGDSFYKQMLIEGSPQKNYAVSRWGEGITLMHQNYSYTEWRNEEDSVYMRMLFDHQADPMENTNLAVDHKYDSLMTELSNKLVRNRGDWFSGR
jgi:arylsulfatase A-like enzyme